jgi:hypothetical protein
MYTGQTGETYLTPYGAIELLRHVSQRYEAGAAYCPLHVNARIVGSSPPLFARQLSSVGGYVRADATLMPYFP